MPPLIQQEKDILATLASEQEEIRRLAAVQRAAQVHFIVGILVGTFCRHIGRHIGRHILWAYLMKNGCYLP